MPWAVSNNTPEVAGAAAELRRHGGPREAVVVRVYCVHQLLAVLLPAADLVRPAARQPEAARHMLRTWVALYVVSSA